jgi:RimJ/RimL family protein N-acetyltransferase
MVKKNRTSTVTQPLTGPVDCACVIHGTGYGWEYVDRLYNMLTRHISVGVRLHVYTEEHRDVPAPYIKHSLLNWGIGGPKKSWWYKMQLFNTDYHRGPLLYFDLDTVIVDNLDWIWQLPLHQFWTVRDFKYLWKPTNYSVNSSIMWWDTQMFDHVWRNFKSQELDRIISKYHGDQDYITEVIPTGDRRFFDQEQVKSWRWQCFDGGYNFAQKRHLAPNTGTVITHPTSVMVFHGKPKPDKVQDSVILQHWQ